MGVHTCATFHTMSKRVRHDRYTEQLQQLAFIGQQYAKLRALSRDMAEPHVDAYVASLYESISRFMSQSHLVTRMNNEWMPIPNEVRTALEAEISTAVRSEITNRDLYDLVVKLVVEASIPQSFYVRTDEEMLNTNLELVLQVKNEHNTRHTLTITWPLLGVNGMLDFNRLPPKQLFGTYTIGTEPSGPVYAVMSAYLWHLQTGNTEEPDTNQCKEIYNQMAKFVKFEGY